jgi:hypothetical protein
MLRIRNLQNGQADNAVGSKEHQIDDRTRLPMPTYTLFAYRTCVTIIPASHDIPLPRTTRETRKVLATVHGLRLAATAATEFRGGSVPTHPYPAVPYKHRHIRSLTAATVVTFDHLCISTSDGSSKTTVGTMHTDSSPLHGVPHVTTLHMGCNRVYFSATHFSRSSTLAARRLAYSPTYCYQQYR